MLLLISLFALTHFAKRTHNHNPHCIFVCMRYAALACVPTKRKYQPLTIASPNRLLVARRCVRTHLLLPSFSQWLRCAAQPAVWLGCFFLVVWLCVCVYHTYLCLHSAAHTAGRTLRIKTGGISRRKTRPHRGAQIIEAMSCAGAPPNCLRAAY